MVIVAGLQVSKVKSDRLHMKMLRLQAPLELAGGTNFLYLALHGLQPSFKPEAFESG